MPKPWSTGLNHIITCVHSECIKASDLLRKCGPKSGFRLQIVI